MTNIEHSLVSRQAYAVAALLEIDNDREDIYGNMNHHTRCAAWYNGRERGISLTTYTYGTNTGRALCITFGEERRSDCIFADAWEVKLGINPPSVNDFTEDVYANRRVFAYGKFLEVSECIHGLLAAYTNVARSNKGK